MTHNYRKNIPVLTADEYQLGQVQALYHRNEPADPPNHIFASYLMVINNTIGDDYYVPVNVIDEQKSDETAVWLQLTRKAVLERQLSVVPHFIAADAFTETALPEGEMADKGKSIEDDIMPLSPNQS